VAQSFDLGKRRNTRFVRGWCLEVHDLAIAKYAAGREKDRDYTRSLAKHRMIWRDLLERSLTVTELGPEIRSLVEKRMEPDFDAANSPV
jgi:hypothetical protein